MNGEANSPNRIQPRVVAVREQHDHQSLTGLFSGAV